MVSFLEALSLGTNIGHTTRTHTLPLFESLGSIISCDIFSTKSLPCFDNSAMDGYAIMLKDYGSTCICDGSILAGMDSSGLSLTQGHTYKVMTGAMLPHNTEAVVQLEWSKTENNVIHIPAPECHQNISKWQNIRFKGEEIAQDSLLIHKGSRLNHLDLSILASQGISHVQSFIPLNIGIFSSGDEVIEPGEVAKAHQIYNTNATSIYSILKKYGYKCHYGGILKDEKNALYSKIESFTDYDVVITSGGASVGDADLMKSAIGKMGGKFLFDGINLKPGRHLACAMLKKTLIILLPGNPLALLLQLHTLILCILESLQGGRMIYPKSISLKIDKSLNLKANTTNMILGKIQNDTFLLYKNGKIGSSSLVNMWENNAIAIFDKTQHIGGGTNIKIIPYNTDFCDIMDFIN